MPSRKVSERNRPGARDRGYDRRWDRVSREFLWRNPWCLGCSAIGVKKKAQLVDHIVPHKGDLALFWVTGNWQPCCAWHHNSIKPELERRHARGQIAAYELRLDSRVAAQLTRERHRPAVGADGFAVAGS